MKVYHGDIVKRTKDQILSLLVLAGLWAYFHHQVLFQGQTFVLEDSSRFFFPLWKWGSDVLHQGLIPLWNPDAGMGTPYLADPEMAVWYPPLRLFYFLFSPVTAFNFAIVGHHLLGMVGFWAYARQRGASCWASLAGALLFGFPAAVVCFTWDPVMLLAYAWVPWIFLARERLGKGRVGAPLGFSFCLAMQMAAGYPLFCYLTLLALALEWVLRSKGRLKEMWGAYTGWLVLGAGLALVFNLSWGLPFIEFKGLSNIDRRLGMFQSLPLESLMTWLEPFHSGHPLHRSGPIPYWLSTFFMGIPALTAMVWGAFKRKVEVISLGLFFLFTVLAMGSTLVLGDGVRWLVPFYHWVARSGYLLILVFFYAARSSVEALAGLVEGKAEGKVEWGWALLTLLFFLWAFGAGTPTDLASAWVACALCLCAAFKDFFPPGARWAFLLCAIVLSLGPADQNLNFTMERGFYEDSPPILEKMRAPGRIYQSPKVTDSYGVLSATSIGGAYGHLKEALAPDFPLAFGREELSFVNPLMLDFYLRCYLWEGEGPPQKVLDYLGVSYSMDEAGKLSVDPGAYPKWFSVRIAGPLRLSKESRAFPYLLPDDLRNNCQVSHSSAYGEYSPREVSETFRGPGHIGLMAKGKGRALLVSSETAYPGWRAAVKGEPRPVEVVNGGFRGAVLNDGEEEVSLSYQPTSFKLGCFLSLLVCGLWLGLALKWGAASQFIRHCEE